MIILEEVDAVTGKHSYGMSSGQGDTTDDLPTDVPQGSMCMDYTTLTPHSFDGIGWN